jgi:hypothetical protein
MNVNTKDVRGFTVVELLIAMVLGLLLIGAAVAVFVENRHGFNRDETVLRMQDDARQAVREVANDLGMAGFLADIVLPAAVIADPSLAITTDCGPVGAANWIYRLVQVGTGESLSVTMVDNATGASANAAFSCIDPAELRAGTDVIAVKRVAGAQTGAVAVDSVYLRTNGTLGLLYREPEAVPPGITVPAPFSEWEYRPTIYYVRNFAVRAGDGIPTLCRKVLRYGGTPTMQTECLAQGIENLQIEYGLDDNGDGEPDVFVTNPTLAQLQMAVAARLFVLSRSVESDIRYENQKTYLISNSPAYAPADAFYRRVYSITVGLRNLRSLRMLRS